MIVILKWGEIEVGKYSFKLSKDFQTCTYFYVKGMFSRYENILTIKLQIHSLIWLQRLEQDINWKKSIFCRFIET